jgi:two-component system cell cycle response regulator CtrA
MRLLLAESNVKTALDAAQMLMASQIVVDTTDTGASALNLIKHYDYDALLVNFTLADMNACEVLRRLRKTGSNLPVLVLSGLSETTDRVKAFEHGADDVVSMPVENAELVARVQAIVRRTNGYSHSILQIGALVLDLANHSLLVHGQPVHLTCKEFAVLSLLMQRRDKIISKDSFLSHLYGGLEEPEIKIVDVFICKVRRKLARAGADNVIGTIWGSGYILRDRATTSHADSGELSISCTHEILASLAA